MEADDEAVRLLLRIKKNPFIQIECSDFPMSERLLSQPLFKNKKAQADE
ncbi:hypothetical protein GCM10007096_37860 [Pullulanibacillus pueri]|uniref:Uncharacterized protein n=1 Tax=Pullulanibacillus pueri TaxID=1437324 RepID=A0A8J3ENR9_9BACL|nr:hypothetical protein GCM10007096_37860 [Pullulanibacillus pueri]